MLYSDICDLSCFKQNGKVFDKHFKDVVRGKRKEIVLPIEVPGYTVQYAPLGNYPEKPMVIICGKTVSSSSHNRFIEALQGGRTLHEACFSSIFSNMRVNLFNYLERIKLFDFLENHRNYWRSGSHTDQWNRMFEDLESSLASGIQLTQVFNCAILNNNPERRSAEPPRAVFRQVQQQSGCMFDQFRISENLRLIIFLDTPSDDNRFHQVDFWERYWNEERKIKYPGVQVISITHPSNQNAVIYNNLENWGNIANETKRNRARALFENAREVVANLNVLAS